MLYEIDCNIQIVLSEGSNEFTVSRYNFCVYGKYYSFSDSMFLRWTDSCSDNICFGEVVDWTDGRFTSFGDMIFLWVFQSL